MANFMIDIETLGTKPDAAIVQIGIAQFDKEKVLGSLKVNVTPHPDASMDFSTVQWWAGQSDEARRSVFNGHYFDPKEALENLTEYIMYYTGDEPPVVWSKPSAFDIVILESLYRQCGLTPPWKHWNTRCLRTLIEASQLPFGEQVAPETAHDAASDAEAQAKTAIKCFELINKA